MKEMVGGCCVCSDERGWPDNPLVYCDGNGCTVAVHQACYGIVTVPTGPWFCRKCESPETKGKVKCELCPSKSGALKRTDTGGWAHVVCALYIPEVRFGNVTSMEPIVLRLIPPERYNKTCYICHDLGKSHRSTAGACMQCNKSGCRQQFHVTCAQSLGLLCEEAGNYLDNVKYCGYCQHHYSKLPGRKSSHTSVVQGKSTPNSKNPTNAIQPMGGKLQHSSDKKKPSPARRGSTAGDGSGSKSSTPAPSPQHSADAQTQGSRTSSSGSFTPATKASPSPKSQEPVGVISSIASATIASAPASAITAVPTSSPAVVSVVQPPASKPTTYQESVITNTEAIDTKQTKKRKAVTAANAINTPIDYAAPPPTTANEQTTQHGSGLWDANHSSSDVQMDEKIVKKAKTDGMEVIPSTSHFSTINPAPPLPPPPPAYSPHSQPSPRHPPSPMPGPSGINSIPLPGSNIRSPSQPMMRGERVEPASLLVSIPLPSSGLNLDAHGSTKISAPQEIPGPSSHIFHQPLKQAAMDPGIPGHSTHSVSGRSNWGNLNVAYEMQQDPSKPGVSGMAGTSKDTSMAGPTMPMPPTTIRNKKRAAMAASVANTPPPSATQSSHTQSLAGVRRRAQPPPAPLYQETIKDSPPSSPNSERPLKPKSESKGGGGCTAPHMLGNELNPESGAAARLQEQLNAELAAHAAGAGPSDALVPPPLINKAATANGSGRSSSAQSLDQLLERQWEQGSQFLMEQAQHFDIASLLSCLHQLRTENVRLEEHVGNLLQRRDHLLAVNARLAIPLTAVAAGPPEPNRCSRESGSQARAPPAPVRNETITSERSHQQMMMPQKPS